MCDLTKSFRNSLTIHKFLVTSLKLWKTHPNLEPPIQILQSTELRLSDLTQHLHCIVQIMAPICNSAALPCLKMTTMTYYACTWL